MSILTDFRLTVQEQNLNIYGIHVYQNGKTLAAHRFRSDDRINLCSGAKTFVAVGVGIALDEGLFRLQDKVLGYFPEYQSIAVEGAENIKIEHLLQMTSGHMTEAFSKYDSMDRAELFFQTPLMTTPGTYFFYEDLCTYMLGRIIEAVTGDNLLEYLKPRLFDKLEIVNPQWHTCLHGHTSCAGGLYLTTEEYARLGILLLHEGIYKGRRVVSESYVQQMHSKWVDTSYKNDPETQQGYGYQIWKCSREHTYRANGMYGQVCIILEDYNAVITFTGHYEVGGYDNVRAVWRDILPHLD